MHFFSVSGWYVLYHVFSGISVVDEWNGPVNYVVLIAADFFIPVSSGQLPELLD